jgi:glycerol kinase
MLTDIDIGTSSVKAVVADDSQAMAAQAAVPLIIGHPQLLYSEQDLFRSCPQHETLINSSRLPNQRSLISVHCSNSAVRLAD